MALIKCPECAREISDKAPACPHCGAPAAVFSPAGAAVTAPPPEVLIWEGSPSQLTAFGYYFVLGLVVVGCAASAFFNPLFIAFEVIPLLLILLRYIRIHSIHYRLSSQRVTIRSGLFSRTTEEVELFRVKDTGLDEPFFGRLLGIGRIIIIPLDATATQLTLVGIPNAGAMRNTLRDKIVAERLLHRVNTVEEI